MVQQKTICKKDRDAIFGEIPINWEEVTLEEIIVEHKELTVINNQYPVLTSSRNGLVKQEEYYNNRQIITDNVGYHVIPRGYFTYRSRSDDGTFVFNINNIVDKGIVSYFYPVFRIEKANAYYTWLFINNLLSNQIRKEIVGTSQLVLSLNKLKKMKILLPPIHEQQYIADIISNVDEQIEMTDQLISKTKELKKSLMQQLMIKGIGHTKFKATELGEIPIDWEEKTIGDLIKFEGGQQPPRKYFINEEKEGYIRLIQIRDYKTEKYKTYIPTDIAKRFCDENDIMIGRYGPPIFQILRGIKGAYNVALIKATPNKKLLKTYAYYYLCNDRLFKLIERLSQRTSGQTGIDMEALRTYPLPLPTLQEQQKIAEILSTVDEQIKSYEQEKEKYKELKKGLMQQLLTGKLRVTV